MKVYLNDEGVLQVCQLLRSLIGGGHSLEQALYSAATQIDEGNVASVLRCVHERVAAGHKLWAAMSHSSCFPVSLVNMVKLGEENNRLTEVLELTVSYLEADLRLRRMVHDVMTYPLVITATLLLIMPIYAQSYAVNETIIDRTVSLSTPMILVATLWRLVGAAAPLFYGAALFVFTSLALMGTSYAGRLTDFWDSLLFRLPGLRTLQKYRATARLAWLLHIPLSAGMPLPEALTKTATMDLPKDFSILLSNLATRANKGMELSSRISSAACLPFTGRCMLSMAEEDNSLVPTLKRVAHIYEDETKRLARSLPSVIALFSMIGLSVIVSLALLMMYYPILKLPLLQGV